MMIIGLTEHSVSCQMVIGRTHSLDIFNSILWLTQETGVIWKGLPFCMYGSASDADYMFAKLAAHEAHGLHY